MNKVPNLSVIDKQVLNNASYRGLGCKYDVVVFAGSNSSVYKAEVGNTKLNYLSISNNLSDSLELRDVAILSKDTYLLMSAGEGESSQIWRTENGGKSWTKTYSAEYAKAFFDGFDFFDNKHGFLVSDPIDEYLYLLETIDGGKSWKRVQSKSLPKLKGKEYGFAASGSSLKCFDKNKIVIGTGGEAARLFISEDAGASWKVQETLIQQGKTSKGIFSIDVLDNGIGIAAGGDYSIDTLAGKNIFSFNMQRNNHTMHNDVVGYKSCIKFLNNKVILTTGTSGTNLSINKGNDWKTHTELGAYHSIAFDSNNQIGFLSGAEGKICQFILNFKN